MTWAVIRTGGKQYKVSVGETIDIEKLKDSSGEVVSFSDVLAVGGDEVKIGTPVVEKAKVMAKVVKEFKGPKIRVVKFKSKSRYTRTTGHRQQLTQVTIEKISA